jgi:cell division protein FtsQ
MMSVAIPARPLLKRVRTGNLFSKAGSTVLDAPERDYAQSEAKTAGFKRRSAVTEMPLRRDSSYADDYADDLDPEFSGRARRPSVRLSFDGGLIPKTLWGRIAAGGGLLCVGLAAIAGALWVRSYVLHDAHFVVPGSESIQIAGNSHVSRAQLLSVFGEDVERNIFQVPLAARRAELESLPWVEHATVMRLLPDRVRVAIVERTPVAFVRQGSQIGLVDANGVLFDLSGPDVDESSGGRAIAHHATHYSFPVLTGISAGDPLSVRAARMRIYLGFIAALDANGEGISKRLSEVDLSNPEDVKAVIPDAGSSGADILVHFGEEKFLERYRQYQSHLAEWRTQYPKLASVDMRYEQQVVLQMQPGATVPAAGAASNVAANSDGAASVKPEAAKAAAPIAAAKLKKPVARAQSRAAAIGHARATAQNSPRGVQQ